MKLNLLKNLSIALAVSAFAVSCASWTDVEHPNFDNGMIYYPQEHYDSIATVKQLEKERLAAEEAERLEKERIEKAARYAALREYRKTDHKIMFGWFGTWVPNSENMNGRLCNLPDSVDLISLWGGSMSFGNWSEEHIKDLREFQERGSKVLLCITPGMGAGTSYKGSSVIEYANAIADTIQKYGLNGFDADMEGSYVNINELFKQLRVRGVEILTVDIPGGNGGWYSYVTGALGHLSAETIRDLDYIEWQSYEENQEGMTRLFASIYKTAENKQAGLGAEVIRKSIHTYTFERGTDKHLFTDNNTYRDFPGGNANNTGVSGYVAKTPGPAGMGAYHIEYDEENNYNLVRAAIRAQNPRQ